MRRYSNGNPIGSVFGFLGRVIDKGWEYVNGPSKTLCDEFQLFLFFCREPQLYPLILFLHNQILSLLGVRGCALKIISGWEPLIGWNFPYKFPACYPIRQQMRLSRGKGSF